MKVIKSEMHSMFDVDDTLVMWLPIIDGSIIGKISILDPYDNKPVFLSPHKKHIKILKDLKLRGYTITVWSANGYKWAEAVVRALGLEEHVDLVMTKPTKIFDDLPLTEAIGARVYIPYRAE